MPISIVPAPVVTELQRQFNYEFAAAHAYRALSLWSAVRNYKGFAEFFGKQANEEREHAHKLTDHLINRGVDPVLTAVPAPRQNFDTLAQIAARSPRSIVTSPKVRSGRRMVRFLRLSRPKKGGSIIRATK